MIGTKKGKKLFFSIKFLISIKSPDRFIMMSSDKESIVFLSGLGGSHDEKRNSKTA